ncbi:hypothetical protein JTB14_016531 [Gonioctena quinquepunctata]|nr:hypothetical protein JTB14_016531 [Gonioctena quinquepunctata]
MVDKLVNSEANTRRIAMVESCFGSSGQPLGVPGRVLVGEGVLTKMCRKKPKTRQFFLFNDILVYEVKLESLQDDNQYKNGWLIKTASKSFAVYAATAVEKGEWMAHINKCIDDLLRKSGKKAVAEHAAVWVPDGEAPVCMHCKKTQFTLLNRRHHCRKCGAVVCGPCSNKRFLLPNQSSKPLRVCLHCYDALTTATTKNHHSIDSATKGGLNADSSGEDDSDDDEETAKGQPEAHDLPKFYGDNEKNE